jgi:hypothetical protein
VDVNAPKGTFVKAASGGLFKSVKMNRGAQMQTASDYEE